MKIDDERDLLRGDYPLSWPEFAAGMLESAAEIPPDAVRARIRRVKASHRGIAARRGLRALEAAGVNQPFLEEISALKELRFLHLDHPVTAADLSPLARLENLRTLMMTTVRNASDFGPVLALPRLEVLLIEQAKHIHDLGFLSTAHHLRIIGIEGGMWSKQNIASLAPLAGLRGLEELHLASVKLGNTDLSPLAACPNLRLLRCARFAPKQEFERLRALMPDLECSWCDRYEVG